MDCEDETVEEHDKYAFFLGSAIRNEDPEQFLTVYDSIIPKSLPEEAVERIKERSRAIAGLPEKEFNELNARDYSLAQDRQKMTSSASGKDAFFCAEDAEDLRYIDDEDVRDDESTDDSQSPPKNDRHIPPLIGLLKPPDLDDFEPFGSDSGVFNTSKATGTTSVGSGSDKQDDSDTEFPYTRLNSSCNANPVAAVNNQHYDEVYRIDSDSGSQLDLESPRSDTSLPSSVEGRSNACKDVEMETFCTSRARSYSSIDMDCHSANIHKHLYGSERQSYDHAYSSLKKENKHDSDEFGVSDLPEDSKTRFGQRSSPNIYPVNKVSSGVDDPLQLSLFPKTSSLSDADKNRAYFSSRSSRNSCSLDSHSHFPSFLLNESDDDKKKKKKKKGSKDDNDISLLPRKERSETDVNGNPVLFDPLFVDYASKRKLKSKTGSCSSQAIGLDSSLLTTSNNDGEDNTNGGNGQKGKSKTQKKKCREKEVHPEQEEGYIGDKDIDFILNALKENEKGSKPKKLASSGQRDGSMALQTVSKVEKSESKTVKNSKSEKKQKQQVVHVVSTCLNNEASTVEDIVTTKPAACEVNNLYAYNRLKDCTGIPRTLCMPAMGAANGKLESSDLEQVIVEQSQSDFNPVVPKGCDGAKMMPTPDEQQVGMSISSGEKLSKIIDDVDKPHIDNTVSSTNTCTTDTAKVSLKVELSSNPFADKQCEKDMSSNECPPGGVNPGTGEEGESKSPSAVKAVTDFVDIGKNCDNLDLIEVTDDLRENGPPDKYSDFYIFTDVEIQPVDRDAEFCPVVHKKKKRTTAKDPAPVYAHNRGGGGPLPSFPPRTSNFVGDSHVINRDFSHRNADGRKFTRSVTPPPSSQSIENQKLRDLSPSAFPALRRSAAGKGTMTEGRRNSTGDVSMEVSASRIHDDSDLESVKSLPAATQTSDTSPGVTRPIISYAKVAASPKPHSTSPLSPPSNNNQESGADDMSPARQQTVWKGNVRERRHSLGSSPEAPTEEAKLMDAMRQKSGSQTCLAAECACTVSHGSMCKNIKCTSDLSDTDISVQTADQSDMKVSSLLTDQLTAGEKATVCKSSPKLGCFDASVPAVSFHVDSVISTASSTGQPSGLDRNNPGSERLQNMCSAADSVNSEINSVDRVDPRAGSTSTCMPEKAHRGSHPQGAVLKLPPNNGKKFKHSVIFLDKRLAGPPRDLGITFGFEPDWESGQTASGVQVSVEGGEVEVNMVPELNEGRSVKNDLTGPISEALTPSNAGSRKPPQPKQTDPASLPLRSVPNVQGSVKPGSKPVNSAQAALKGDTAPVPSHRQTPAPAPAAQVTKQANKGVYAVPALNGVVMSLVQGDKSSPASTTSSQDPALSCSPSSGSTNKLSDSAILFSSENPPPEPHPSCPLPGPLSEPPNHSACSYHSDPSSSSTSSPSPMSTGGGCKSLVSVVYGKSIPLVCLSTSSLRQNAPPSCSGCPPDKHSDMTCGTPGEKNGPQKIIKFQLEDATRGKFNWEEAAKFLKKEWDNILAKKEKNPDSVVMYSCNSAC